MLDYSTEADGELAELVRRADHDAFAEIVRRHTQRYFALAFRTLHNQSDAEDIVQACFIKFWQRPHLWQADKSQFTTWFYRVVINACYDLLRRKPNMHADSVDSLESLLPMIASEEQLAENKQALSMRQHLLERAMLQLTDSQRDAINLVVYGELPQKQAAEVLGVSLKALESLLIRAKRNLKKSILTFKKEFQKESQKDCQETASVNDE